MIKIPYNSKKLYNCRIKTYPDGRQNITCFSMGIFNPEKWEETDTGFADFINHQWLKDDIVKAGEGEYIRQYNIDGLRMDNLKRSREKVFDIAFMNSYLWHYMVTFTLDSKKIDRYQADKINPKFQKWLDNSVQRKDINYLLVAEPHKDTAIHFHGLMSDGLNFERSYNDKKKEYRKDKNGRPVFDVLDYPFGFARAVPIDEGTEINCCKYITKYMTKDFTKIFGHMYWAGGKKLLRDVDVRYCDISFADFPSEPYKVLNGGYYVKYLLTGVTL